MVIASGSRARPTHLCDRWVCDLGDVGASSVFGWVRGVGIFVVVIPTFVLVARMNLAQQYRGNGHFLSVVSSSRLKAMVGGALTRASVLCVRLGVSGSTIVSGSYTRPSYSWISHLWCRLLTSSLSLGISSFFCRVNQCV